MISDWERDGELHWKSGLLFATRLRHGRALWVKAEAPWGEHRNAEWTLRASIAWRKRNASERAAEGAAAATSSSGSSPGGAPAPPAAPPP
jgi:hypothetical protein